MKRNAPEVLDLDQLERAAGGGLGGALVKKLGGGKVLQTVADVGVTGAGIVLANTPPGKIITAAADAYDIYEAVHEHGVFSMSTLEAVGAATVDVAVSRQAREAAESAHGFADVVDAAKHGDFVQAGDALKSAVTAAAPEWGNDLLVEGAKYDAAQAANLADDYNEHQNEVFDQHIEQAQHDAEQWAQGPVMTGVGDLPANGNPGIVPPQFQDDAPAQDPVDVHIDVPPEFHDDAPPEFGGVDAPPDVSTVDHHDDQQGVAS
jgi:hypothetical protein